MSKDKKEQKTYLLGKTVQKSHKGYICDLCGFDIHEREKYERRTYRTGGVYDPLTMHLACSKLSDFLKLPAKDVISPTAFKENVIEFFITEFRYDEYCTWEEILDVVLIRCGIDRGVYE